MSDDSGDWGTIESDPGVFTTLIEEFGVSNVEVTELWSMDLPSLERLVENVEKVYGLIFLFKWENGVSNNNADMDAEGTTKRRKLLDVDEAPSDLFFARQVIHNACATQAILSILFNSPSESVTSSHGVQLGSTLEELKSFMMSLPPDMRGETIGSSDTVRTVHNSFAQRNMFGIDSKKKQVTSSSEDVYHFIAYVPHIQGQIVYELDGLQPGPVSVGTYKMDSTTSTDLSWLDVAREAIQQRIDRYSMGEIKFNLMAVCRDTRLGIQSRINNLIAAGLTDGDEMLEELRVQLMEEEAKRQRWKEENERRRHNYLPLFLEILREYARSGKLPELTRKAQKMAVDTKLQKMK